MNIRIVFVLWIALHVFEGWNMAAAFDTPPRLPAADTKWSVTHQKLIVDALKWLIAKQVSTDDELKQIRVRLDALENPTPPATQPTTLPARPKPTLGVYCDEVQILYYYDFNDLPSLPRKLAGKTFALINYEPSGNAAWVAADSKFAGWLDAIHAASPTILAGVYAWPIVTCSANDPAIRAAMLQMTRTAARVDFLAPDSSQSAPTADPACARLQMSSIASMFPGVPRVPVIKHRVYNDPWRLELVSDKELNAQLMAAFDGADAAILWNLDTYFEGARRSGDPTDSIWKLPAERVFSAEIPAGADTFKWLDWVKKRTLCMARQIMLGTPCVLSNAQGEGIVRQDGSDLTITNTTVMSDSNALFAAPVGTLTINNSSFIIAPGMRPNQYSARLVCKTITATGCVFDNTGPGAESEACLRLISCNSGTITSCSFLGGRIVLDGGSRDEYPEEELCQNLTFNTCYFDVDYPGAGQVTVQYGGCRVIKYNGCRFVVPNGKGISAIDPKATVTYTACLVSRDHAATWTPVVNSLRDFKFQELGNPGLVVTP